MKDLSSSTTRAHKIILPIAWISCFGLGTIGLWLGVFEPLPPAEMKFVFLFAWIVGSVFFIRDAIRIKTVKIEGDQLVIMDFKKIIKVPLSNIKGISETHLVNPKTIKLTVCPATEFGKTLVLFQRRFYTTHSMGILL